MFLTKIGLMFVLRSSRQTDFAVFWKYFKRIIPKLNYMSWSPVIEINSQVAIMHLLSGHWPSVGAEFLGDLSTNGSDITGF